MSETNVETIGTLQELSVQYAKKQPQQVNYLVEETPILSQIKFEPASHPLWNVAEKVTSVEGAGFVKMNSPLPKIGSSSRLEKVDLSIMGGEYFVAQDTAQASGGFAKCLAKKMPNILKASGVSTEKNIIYKNYLQYAIDNERVIDAAGVSDEGLYSLIVVRQVTGENGGLYSSEGFKNGAMLDIQPLYNGALAKDENGVAGYFTQVKGYFGMQLLNPQTVSAIVNISESAIPTKRNITNALLDAKANPANTMIIAHPKVIAWLGDTYKSDILRTTNPDKKLNFLVSHWNDIPMIGSYNFLDGSETEIDF